MGILEVLSECFIDETPRFYPEDDPFVVRFRVRPIVWLPRDLSIPVHEERVWDSLSFTKNVPQSSSAWTGIIRRSLNVMDEADGAFLESLLKAQASGDQTYPVADEEFAKLVSSRIRRADKTVLVAVPEDSPDEDVETDTSGSEPIRKSSHIQAVLAECGERMGFKIWLPRNDRAAVNKEWTPTHDSLINKLPLNYDDTTLKTIE